jgi:hypothetical protein
VPFRLTTRVGAPTFADLSWDAPLADWETERDVYPVAGLHRHVVRFLAYGSDIYALKELPEHLARREYRLLRELRDSSVPVVDAVGLVLGRQRDTGEPLDAVLVTHLLEHSLPYRALFGRSSTAEPVDLLLDALAELLVRLHMVGFFWGDCSLSNSLFRRDAGTLAAYLVDAETGELHEQLSNGQREHDLVVAEANIAGELLDVMAEVGGVAYLDPAALADGLRSRYSALWDELTREEEIDADDRSRIEHRVNRLNELGYDVTEVDLRPAGSPDGRRVRFRTAVVEPGHHRRRLLTLTGLDAEENQARRLLNDIRGYRAELEETAGYPIDEPMAALRWRREVFEPAIAAVPDALRDALEPPELYHQLLEHRWFLSERDGKDVGTQSAVDDYVSRVLVPARAEGRVP